MASSTATSSACRAGLVAPRGSFESSQKATGVSMLRSPALGCSKPAASSFIKCCESQIGRNTRHIVCAAGDVSSEGTNFLIAGAVAIGLIGTAIPFVFSRKDTCPVCNGAGFVRATGVTLRSNAARKDLDQIVCKNCSGLGKIGQTDKKGKF